jgi:hypothetical protein
VQVASVEVAVACGKGEGGGGGGTHRSQQPTTAGGFDFEMKIPAEASLSSGLTASGLSGAKGNVCVHDSAHHRLGFCMCSIDGARSHRPRTGGTHILHTNNMKSQPAGCVFRPTPMEDDPAWAAEKRRLAAAAAQQLRAQHGRPPQPTNRIPVPDPANHPAVSRGVGKFVNQPPRPITATAPPASPRHGRVVVNGGVRATAAWMGHVGQCMRPLGQSRRRVCAARPAPACNTKR